MKKKCKASFIGLFFITATSLLASACGGGEGPSDSGADAGADAGRWPACDKTAAAQKVTFVHVNDIHAGYAMDGADTSPLSRYRGYYEAVKAENPYTIFTNAGDDHEKGSIADILSEGRSTIELTRAMKFDVRTVGNHDFAWSEAEALDYSVDPHSIVLNSNNIYSGAGKCGWTDFGVYEVGCLKIGFFGMVGQPWNELDQQFDGNYYPDIQGRYDFITRATELVKANRDSADLIVMVSHIGLFDDKDVGANVGGIPLILGGHTHTLTTTPDTSTKSVIVQAGAFSKYAGRMDLTVDLATKKVTDHKWQVVENNKGIMKDDPAMLSVVKDVLNRYAPDADKPVAKVSTGRDKGVIARVSTLAAMEIAGADAALIDQGTIWTTWLAGDITPQMLVQTYEVEREPPGTPGFNSLYLAEVSGSDLQKIRTASAGWYFNGPATIDTGKNYTLAAQKRAMLHPEQFLKNAALSAVRPFSEMWDLLVRYGQARQKQCWYLDEQVKIPGCQ
jgi:2',3'-cyclic-nucleotide 2'-phosphodiesterase (5'-nucleotidase family)